MAAPAPDGVEAETRAEVRTRYVRADVTALLAVFTRWLAAGQRISAGHAAQMEELRARLALRRSKGEIAPMVQAGTS
jgi:hypothetical protein